MTEFEKVVAHAERAYIKRKLEESQLDVDYS